jgi:hypothetical protein
MIDNHPNKFLVLLQMQWCIIGCNKNFEGKYSEKRCWWGGASTEVWEINVSQSKIGLRWQPACMWKAESKFYNF